MSCSSPGLYGSMIDCIVKTVQGEGIGGLYKGILATYVSNITKNAVGFGIYGCTLSHLNQRAGVLQQARDPLQSIVGASLTAGCVASAVECPFEIMAIQLQTQQTRAIEGQLAA